MSKKRKKKGLLFWILLVIFGSFFLTGLIVMLLWNWLIPSILEAVVTNPTALRISYLQSLGLLVLIGLLFGGIRFLWKR